MKIPKVLFAAVLVNLLAATVAVAGGTEKEALAMLDRAVAYIKTHGSDNAFKAFSDPDNKEFHDRDLYVFVYDFKGFSLAHGTNKSMIGKNFMDFKDGGGKNWLPEAIEIAKTKGNGPMDVTWTNPETKKLQAKVSFIRRIPGQDALIGAGIYK